jgi:hypothetical protein
LGRLATFVIQLVVVLTVLVVIARDDGPEAGEQRHGAFLERSLYLDSVPRQNLQGLHGRRKMAAGEQDRPVPQINHEVYILIYLREGDSGTPRPRPRKSWHRKGFQQAEARKSWFS